MRQSDPHAQQRIDLAPILSIQLNEKSRDEKVKLMRGLQAVYADESVRREVLDLVRKDVVGEARMDTGRPGMDLWSIFVLIAFRETLKADYDEMQDLAEHHRLLRAAMGIGQWDERKIPWNRVWANVTMVRSGTVADINRRILRLGHQAAPEASATVRVDSFVMQVNMHHPSDVRQVADGLRVVLRHGARLAEAIGSTLLRQHRHLERRARAVVLTASKACASRGRGREQRLRAAVAALCDFADQRCEQALALCDEYQAKRSTLAQAATTVAHAEHALLMHYLGALATCAHVARERLALGREVALSDRLFSIFEPHAECIHRGKARAAVEFGHRVLISEDAAGFIIDARVMPNGQQDRDAAIPLVEDLAKAHTALARISFDRGFHSPENAERIPAMLPGACLPNSGDKAFLAQMRDASTSWRWMRRRHAGVEAAIGSLQDNRGCRRCPDKGRDGFARFLQTAVLANNLVTLGRILWTAEAPGSAAGRTRRQAA